MHDLARKQELEIGGAQKYFKPLEKAIYKDDFWSCTIWVAKVIEQTVGFVAVHPHELTYIYVHPDFQGNGIGFALAKKALLNLERPVTLDVFVENEKAKSLYRKLGFVSQEVKWQQWDLMDPKKYSDEKMILN
ncbi:GNAT family N-acetyltransferase [uncultured Lactobacillus sp.]|uniref:GNAT family N-acetyltransferase n=1 Tax=uncultured Lactobacillus sp. TaxID=153152 RepID=UPI00345DA82E